MNISNTDFLYPFVVLTNFLGDFLGSNYEVVLHDVRNPEKSVITIKNPIISGRALGSPLTDFSLKIIKERLYLKQDYICNYKSIGSHGKQMNSATYFIKDDKENLVGLLCINMDISRYLDFKNIMDSFIGTQSKLKETSIENISTTTLEELTTQIINQVLENSIIAPERMSSEEKIDIVSKLQEKGVFLLKGSIIEVSHRLKTSEATIYRYLKQLDRR